MGKEDDIAEAKVSLKKEWVEEVGWTYLDL